MRKIKISIIVAVYNTSEYLRMCLDKVTSQTLLPEEYEVIVVNDCSTDNSAEIVMEYINKGCNIKFIDKKVNEATFWSRVDGMHAARGQYVGFVDSDDWIENDMFSSMFKFAEEQQAEIVECGYQKNGIEESSFHYQLNEGIYSRNQIIDRYVKRQINASLWMRIYSIEIVKRVLDSTITLLNHNEYIGIRNEDEFIYPLLLNECTLYYVVNFAPYHYRIDTSISIMSEIKENIGKKFFHAKTVLAAGNLLLDKTKDNKKIFKKYKYLQVNNMFYYMGIILSSKSWNEIAELKKRINNFNFYYKDKWCILDINLNKRYLHLVLKFIYLNIKNYSK